MQPINVLQIIPSIPDGHYVYGVVNGYGILSSSLHVVINGSIESKPPQEGIVHHQGDATMDIGCVSTRSMNTHANALDVAREHWAGSNHLISVPFMEILHVHMR